MSGLIQLSNSAARWLKIGSKRGVSAIEYGLLAALISLVIVGGVVKVGTNLKRSFPDDCSHAATSRKPPSRG